MSHLPLPMTDESLMPFGKYKGTAMANIPAHYLLWLWENAENLKGPVKGYIQANLDVIKREVEISKRKRDAGR